MADAQNPTVAQAPKSRVTRAVQDKRAREARQAEARLEQRKARDATAHDHNICVRECGEVLAYLRDKGFLQSGNFTAAYSHCSEGRHRKH